MMSSQQAEVNPAHPCRGVPAEHRGRKSYQGQELKLFPAHLLFQEETRPGGVWTYGDLQAVATIQPCAQSVGRTRVEGR